MRTGRGRTMRRRTTEEDDGERRMRLKKTTRRGRMEDIRRQGENDGGEERWRRGEERWRVKLAFKDLCLHKLLTTLQERFCGSAMCRYFFAHYHH
ncbi:unnamed protein product [Cochlearia groenlandica]